MQVQAVIVTRNMLLPYLFKLAEMLERYHPRTALKVLLIRYIYVRIIIKMMINDVILLTGYLYCIFPVCMFL